MASYLSYFTSNSSSAPSQQQIQRVQPATSNWTNTVSARLTTLKKALTKDSEEDDLDHEDCSHVSNVLRAYYRQKGQPRPSWLPDDPKNPTQEVPQNQYGQYGNGYANQYGNQYGNQPGNPYSAPGYGRGTSGGRVGGLNDLFDSTPAQAAPPPSQSLRATRPTPQHLRSSESNFRQQAASDPYLAQSSQPSLGPRPLPSQRAGSFQNTPTAGFTSRSDRLKANLGGNRSGRNSPAVSHGSGSFGESDSPGPQYGGGNAYNTSASEARYDGGRDYGADPGPRGYSGPLHRSRQQGPR